MILAVDIGNTHITGGVFEAEKLIISFRKSLYSGISSDEIGIFFNHVLIENGIPKAQIDMIGCCSVVPSVNYALTAACLKYFGIEPLMIRGGIKTGLKLKCGNPKEIGADRIAASMAVVEKYPGKNIVVVDMGTATTLDVITCEKEYLGGAILSGVNMQMNALASGTAQLPAVEIIKPEKVFGNTTVEAIQTGLYYGCAGAIRELIFCYKEEIFSGQKPFVIATGGFSHLFADYGLFDCIEPNLVLVGVRIALEYNRSLII